MAKKTIEIDVKVDSSQAVKGVDKLGKSTDGLAKSTDKVTESTDELGEGLEGLSGGLDGAISGAKGLGKQFLALVANPIGVVIAALVVVFGTLYKAFSRTEDGGNKLNKGMNALNAVFSAFMNLIEPIASFLVDTFAEAFNYVGNEVDKFVTNLTGALKVLGFNDAADSIDNLVASSEELIAKSNELSDLESKLLKTRREQSLIEKQALIDAEKLRQQRDDESNSLQERIEFNKQLGAVLQKQSKDELAIANDALRAAQLKLEIDGKTTEALDGLAEAQLEILDIQERINGQQSEQLANENSLRNEGKALAKERAEARRVEEEENKKTAEELKLKQEEAATKAQEIEDKKLELQRASGERAIELELELKALRADAGLADPNATAEELQSAFDAKQEIENSLYQIELENNQARFEEGLILEEERNAQKALLEEQHTQNITKIKEDSIDTIKKKEEEAAAFKKKNEQLAAQGTVDTTQAVLGAVGSLLDEGSAEAKAIALAQATISGIQGVQAAYTSASAVPIVGVALGPLAAAAAGVVAGKNIQKIASQKVGKKDKGGSASIGSISSPSASAPSLTDDTLFSTQDLQGVESENIGEGAGINQVKAIVVESDITNTQKKINDIESIAEIG